MSKLIGSMRHRFLVLALFLSGLAISQAWDAPPANACGYVAVAQISPETPTYQSSSNTVTSPGTVNQSPDWHCLVHQVYVRQQSKHCGFWGCNWHTGAASFGNGRTTSWSATPARTCRDGTHRYRTRAGLSWWVWSGPGLQYTLHSEHGDSAIQPEFTCPG